MASKIEGYYDSRTVVSKLGYNPNSNLCYLTKQGKLHPIKRGTANYYPVAEVDALVKAVCVPEGYSSSRELARLYGVSISALSDRLRRNGVKPIFIRGKRYYHKETVITALAKKKFAVPDGYLTWAQTAELLGYDAERNGVLDNALKKGWIRFQYHTDKKHKVYNKIDLIRFKQSKRYIMRSDYVPANAICESSARKELKGARLKPIWERGLLRKVSVKGHFYYNTNDLHKVGVVIQKLLQTSNIPDKFKWLIECVPQLKYKYSKAS